MNNITAINITIINNTYYSIITYYNNNTDLHINVNKNKYIMNEERERERERKRERASERESKREREREMLFVLNIRPEGHLPVAPCVVTNKLRAFGE